MLHKPALARKSLSRCKRLTNLQQHPCLMTLSTAKPLMLSKSLMSASMQSNKGASLVMPALNYIRWHHKLVPCCANIEALHESEEIQCYSFGKLSTTCYLGSLLLLQLPCRRAHSLSDMQHAA